MKKPTFNTLLVGGGFLLGTAGIKLLASAPVKNACVQGIACGMLPSSTSWRTASLRPSKGVAPSSVPRTLYLRMRARSSSPTFRSKSSLICRACRRCI